MAHQPHATAGTAANNPLGQQTHDDDPSESHDENGVGCVTCRYRAKKCPETRHAHALPNQYPPGPCSECVSHSIQCLGYRRDLPISMEEGRKIVSAKLKTRAKSNDKKSPVDLGELWEQTGYALGFGRGAGPSTAGPSTAGPSTAGTPIAGAPPVESALHTGTPLAVPPVHGAPTTGFTSSGPAENAHPVMPFLNGLQGTSFTGHVAAGSPPSEDALLAWHVMGNVPFINALYVWHSEDGAFNNSVPVGWYPIGGAPAAGFAGHGITADSPPSENALLVWHVVGNALFIDALYVWHSVDGAFNSHAPLVWYPIGDAPPVGTLLAVPPTATYLSTLPPEPAEASSPDDLEIIISSYDSQM